MQLKNYTIKPSLNLVMAQLNFLVGDVFGNSRKIIAAIEKARTLYDCPLIVFPELCLTGYPPEDLLFKSDLYLQIDQALQEIQTHARGVEVILGLPAQQNGIYYNQAVLMQQGKITASYHKQKLPNYSVFDEARYFQPGTGSCLVTIQNIPTALIICEDLWHPEPIAQAKAAGAELLICINASPFSINKMAVRQKLVTEQAEKMALPIVYVNSVGAQDELVFDGGSMVVNAQGQLITQADFFVEALCHTVIDLTALSQRDLIPAPLLCLPSKEQCVYNALVLGVRDYIEKNKFSRALIGLSGGIDSALTLAIAVDAIGKERVEAVMMPSRYTAEISLIDAKTQADLLAVKYHLLPIEPVFSAFLTTLAPTFKGLPLDTTEENLQARCRGVLLMALSNKMHAIVLSTGNKSENAVGYATLYGDMVGGFCVLKDVFKTLVYQLAHYRNGLSAAIPQRVIDRAPTAELRENQTDQDSLPPYPILDEILERYVERDESLQIMIAAGLDEQLVRRVIKMVNLNEYKRRQAAPGVRITERAFGKDRRYPITSGFSLL